MASRKYVGDPAFKAEMDQIAADHAGQPISAEERAKLATPITQTPRPMHKHEEDCWGEVVQRMLAAPDRAGFIKVKVQICRHGGAIREVKDAT